MSKQFANPQEIANAGQRIYDAKYRDKFASEYPGQFIAIDVATEAAFVSEQPEAALEKAKKASPNGIFHLIKIGSSGAFRVSYTSNADSNWLF